MKNNISPYEKGEVKWVFLLKGSYPHYTSEYVIQVKFTHYVNDSSYVARHEVEILRGDLMSGGFESVPCKQSDLKIDETKVFDTFTEAKNHLIKFLEYKKELAFKRAESDMKRRMNQFGDWENSPFNKDLIRESKINSICNEH